MYKTHNERMLKSKRIMPKNKKQLKIILDQEKYNRRVAKSQNRAIDKWEG